MGPIAVRSLYGGRATHPERVRESLGSLAFERFDLVWAVLPEVAMRLANPAEIVAPPGPVSAGPARNLVRARSVVRGPRITQVGRHLLLSTSHQTSRVLDAIGSAMMADGCPARRPQLRPLGSRELIRIGREARHASRALKAWLAAAGLPVPRGLTEELGKAAVFRRRLIVSDLKADGVESIVVASQHNSFSRAATSAAFLHLGMATTYIPHAPAAANCFYRDLPTHFAAMRGSAERDYYLEFGADLSRLAIVGGVESGGLNLQNGRAGASVFYAPSPSSVDLLRRDVQVIKAATPTGVQVCPHPRMGVEVLRSLVPHNWTIHPPGRSMETIRSIGAAVVIQHGSGVGAEVLSSGVPLIDLCAFGEEPNYAYLMEPWVAIATNSDELAAAIDRARHGPTSEELIAYARRWTAYHGREAADRAVLALESRTLDEVPSAPVLDGWVAG